MYTAEDTSHFVKYINSLSKKLHSCTFYDIYSVYIEENDDDENINSDKDEK